MQRSEIDVRRGSNRDSEFDNFTKEDFIKYFENKVNSSEQ